MINLFPVQKKTAAQLYSDVQSVQSLKTVLVVTRLWNGFGLQYVTSTMVRRKLTTIKHPLQEVGTCAFYFLCRHTSVQCCTVLYSVVQFRIVLYSVVQSLQSLLYKDGA